MLQITIEGREFFDNDSEEFIETKTRTLQLEHSLISISKWESEWEKPFISDDDKTPEETIDYIRCMTITPNVDPKLYLGLSKDNIDAVNKYIGKKMSATTFYNKKQKTRNKKVVTSEYIYYWMIAYGIPQEYQKWHLSRLLTLINICDNENAPKEKMSRKELAERNRTLNEARRRSLNTKG